MVRLFHVAAVSAAVLVTACAFTPAAQDQGTVSAIYVEPLPGILISPHLAGNAAAHPRWAEVRLDTASAGRTRALARLEVDSQIGIGDRVSVQPGIPDPAAVVPVVDVPWVAAARIRPAGPPGGMLTLLHTAQPRVEILAP